MPLIGIVQTRRPRRRRKSSGDAETIAQPSPTSGRGASGRSGASAPASAAGSPRNGADRCWTRFTWYTSPAAIASRTASTAAAYSRSDHDRSHSPTRRVTSLLQGRKGLVCRADSDRRRRKGAWLRGERRRLAAERRRKPVAEVDVGDEAVGAALEEAFASERGLDLCERADLLHGPTLTSRTCCGSPPLSRCSSTRTTPRPPGSTCSRSSSRRAWRRSGSAPSCLGPRSPGCGWRRSAAGRSAGSSRCGAAAGSSSPGTAGSPDALSPTAAISSSSSSTSARSRAPASGWTRPRRA